jgi:hypothetical protein
MQGWDCARLQAGDINHMTGRYLFRTKSKQRAWQATHKAVGLGAGKQGFLQSRNFCPTVIFRK